MINLPIKPASEIKGIIIDFANIHSVNASKMVDKELKNQLDLVVEKLSVCYFNLNIIVNHTDQKDINNQLFHSQILLWQGLNTFISSLQLLRQGFFTEPNILTRHIVENLALAIKISFDKNAYNQFKEGKLTGEKCIKDAKKIIPILGMVYGTLSQFTHPGKDNLHNYYLEEKDTSTFAIGGGLTKKYLYRSKFNLASIGLLTQVYLGGIEFIYWRYLPELSLWKKTGNFLRWTLNQKEKKFIEYMSNLMFESLDEIKSNQRKKGVNK